MLKVSPADLTSPHHLAESTLENVASNKQASQKSLKHSAIPSPPTSAHAGIKRRIKALANVTHLCCARGKKRRKKWLSLVLDWESLQNVKAGGARPTKAKQQQCVCPWMDTSTVWPQETEQECRTPWWRSCCWMTVEDSGKLETD